MKKHYEAGWKYSTIYPFLQEKFKIFMKFQPKDWENQIDRKKCGRRQATRVGVRSTSAQLVNAAKCHKPRRLHKAKRNGQSLCMSGRAKLAQQKIVEKISNDCCGLDFMRDIFVGTWCKNVTDMDRCSAYKGRVDVANKSTVSRFTVQCKCEAAAGLSSFVAMWFFGGEIWMTDRTASYW